MCSRLYANTAILHVGLENPPTLVSTGGVWEAIPADTGGQLYLQFSILVSHL